MRTIIYIDGLNLYWGALWKTPMRWLDLGKMVRAHLAGHHEVVRIKYFTTRLRQNKGNPGVRGDYDRYLRALAADPRTEVHLGHFLTRRTRMPVGDPAQGETDYVEVWKTEEKGTDVRLATELVNDAHLDRFDCAVIVSGDSDFLPPVETVMGELGKTVGIINPQPHPCAVLKNQATFYKHIRPKVLERCQLPDEIRSSGGIIRKPESW